MLKDKRRQRAGRAAWWIMAGLVLLLALVIGYRSMDWERSVADSQLVEELQQAKLAVDPGKAGAEWPQWRGPHRDGHSAETNLRTEWPKEGLPVLWKVKMGLSYASFAIAEDRVYSMAQEGGEEVVYCWNAGSGKEIWHFAYPAQFGGDSGFGFGPHSTPAVDGDRVYTVGSLGHFHCLKADTGAKLWSHDLLEEHQSGNLRWGVSFSPLVEGDLVYTNPGGGNGNSLAAFNKLTGKLVWKALDDIAGYSSPLGATLAGTRQILFFTANRIVGVSPEDGKLLWSFPWETQHGGNIATPIVVGDYVFISSGYGQGCGLLKVTKEATGSFQVQRVYANNQMNNHFSSSVLYQDHLYGFHETFLTCMNLRTGKVVWKQRGFDKGSLLIAEGHLLILGEKGKLALADATPEGYREKASYQALSERCWSAPALAKGRLYLRDEAQVLCLDLRVGK